MPSAIPQVSFASGEISPSLYGRTDFVRYQTGLKKCRNFIVRPSGGVTNSPGFRYVATCQDSGYAHRLIPFQFSTTQTYILIFGNYTMRIIKNGGVVVYPAGHAQAGEPVEIATLYPSSDLSRLKYTQSADVMTLCHPDYPIQQLSRTDHHLWTFTGFANVNGPFQEINTDTTSTVYASAVTGTVTITASGNIFTSDHVGQMFYVEQSPDSLTHIWEVTKTISFGVVRRAGVNYYQSVSAGVTGTYKPDHTEGIYYDGNTGVAWNYLHSGFGIVLITGFTSATEVTGTVLKRLPESILVTGVSKSIEALTPSSGGSDVSVKITAHGFLSGATVTVAGVVGTTGANGVWRIVYKDVNNFALDGCTDTTAYTSGGTVAPSLASAATYKWAFEAWGADQGYPGCVSYFQQRQIFGAVDTHPQTNWMSKTKGYLDFGVSNPVLDDDAITFTVNSNEVNEIRHFVELGELIALTSAGPWLIRGNQDGMLIPSAISIKRQAMAGVSHVRPVVAGNQAIIVLDKGKSVKALSFSNTLDLAGSDLTVAARHLFDKYSIIGQAYQEVPFGLNWCIRDDGTLLCLTFLPEHQVIGWSTRDTDGLFECAAVVSEGDEDALYTVVNRTINGVEVRYIERLESRIYTDKRDAFFMDSGLTYDGRNIGSTTMTVTGGTNWDETELLTLSASTSTFVATDIGNQINFRDEENLIVYRFTITAYSSATTVTARPNRTIPVAYQATARTDWEFAKNTFTGLDHLEGKTVSVLADGFVEASQLVVDGSISIATPAAVVHVGLPIINDLETLDIYAEKQSIRDKRKICNHVTFIVEETATLQAGTDEDHLTEYKPDFPASADLPGENATGTIDIRIQGTWLKEGHVFVRNDVPLPVSILSVIPEVNIGG